MRNHRSARVLLAVLFGLLALGPFLHVHLGFSKTTGFHIAGYDRTQASVSFHAHQSDLHAQHADLTDAESPALGVSASVVRLIQDPDFPDGLSLQRVVAVLVALEILRKLCIATSAFTGRPSRFRPGFPPPALSPPALS
jgi:hypothetical protein